MDTSIFNFYDMTDPYVLGGDTGDSIALKNNILRIYSMPKTYNYQNEDGYVIIRVLFNNIGKNSSSNYYSIFYGFNTWIYIYSKGGNFNGKTANVEKFNYYNQSTPVESNYTFGTVTDNIGYNLIGFPIIEYWAAGSYMINYYHIQIS